MAVVAAKGVDLRDPLKPQRPDEDQARVLPLGSVTVTRVLLKVDLIKSLASAKDLVMTFFLEIILGVSDGDFFRQGWW